MTVRFWGFRAPLGAWVAIWGAFAMLTSAPFDNWWHNAYGLDVEVLSPPHALLGAGMIAIQLGAMLLALAAQNRRARGPEVRPLGLAHLYAAGHRDADAHHPAARVQRAEPPARRTRSTS